MGCRVFHWVSPSTLIISSPIGTFSFIYPIQSCTYVFLLLILLIDVSIFSGFCRLLCFSVKLPLSRLYWSFQCPFFRFMLSHVCELSRIQFKVVKRFVLAYYFLLCSLHTLIFVFAFYTLIFAYISLSPSRFIYSHLAITISFIIFHSNPD